MHTHIYTHTRMHSNTHKHTWGRFHQRSTYSFYARGAQKQKKRQSSHQFFTLSGSTSVKAEHKYVGEIDTLFLFPIETLLFLWMWTVCNIISLHILNIYGFLSLTVILIQFTSYHDAEIKKNSHVETTALHNLSWNWQNLCSGCQMIIFVHFLTTC